MSDAHDDLTTIHRTTDPAEGEMLVEVLRREGVPARLVRTGSAIIGAAPHIFETRIEVPSASAETARQLIADLVYTGAAEAADLGGSGGDGEGEGAGAAPPLSRRRPMMAAGVAVFIPTGGHLYARRPWTSAVLGAGLIAAVALMIALAGERNYALVPLGAAVALIIG